MYTLFLTLRYLTRMKIVIFPILVVWLCLMMMIIVTSILGGFVDHVRQSNRDLLGDIIVSTRSPAGWSHYEELQKGLAQKFPEVELSTPVVHAFGLISYNASSVPVEVVGIDPAARSKVSRFRETLFHQYISPTDAVKDLTSLLPATGQELTVASAKRVEAASTAFDAAFKWQGELADQTGVPPLQWKWLWGTLVVAVLVTPFVWRGGVRGWIGTIVILIVGLTVVGVGVAWPRVFHRRAEVAEDSTHQAGLNRDRAERTMNYAASLPADQKFTTEEELEKLLVPVNPSFAIPAVAQDGRVGKPAPDQEGCIIGSQIGFFSRDSRGNFERSMAFDYFNVRLTVVPVSESGTIRATNADLRVFTVVDDSYSGVYDVDSLYVYAPFATVQSMAGLRVDDPDSPPGSPGYTPPRCTELLIKLKGTPDPDAMRKICSRIDEYVAAFESDHPDMGVSNGLEVQTWDQKQKKYISAVENERNMMTFILGLMSLVVIVVIFLIFYMIVRDKTRDIGIVKAVGGSEEGVAMIFLCYGLFVGLVGGLLGVVTGVAFVTHTNQIHEFIFQMTGLVIWDRSVYVFDRIPDTVHPAEVALYFGAALVAGVVGALIPAVVAASEDPVKAVRYE